MTLTFAYNIITIASLIIVIIPLCTHTHFIYIYIVYASACVRMYMCTNAHVCIYVNGKDGYIEDDPK